jgi:flagellar biosynthesis/type III secretory pathway protein FliH
MRDIDIDTLKIMLKELQPKKEEVLDRNKQLFDLMAARIQEAYSQGYEEGYNQGRWANNHLPAMEQPPYQNQRHNVTCACGSNCCKY